MPNIIDYIKWRGDIGFESSPFNEIDSLIFAELSYIPFEKVIDETKASESLKELSAKFFSYPAEETKLGAIIPEKEIKELLMLAGNSNRFKNVKLRNYISKICTKEEIQFCGMCFVLNKKECCIAYRGTDDTLVGWKEDFNMSFNTPIPSQIESVKYLDSVGLRASKTIYVCGHSKGGNLASYAALFACKKVKKKIATVHSFDGPGFRSDFLENIEEEDIKLKTTKYLPQSSIIGMIYDSVGECVAIKSDGKGIYQHDAFKWNVLGDKFLIAEKLDKSSTDTHDLLNKWTKSMSKEERIEFVEALYKLITVNESATLSDIASDKFKFILGIIKSDGKTKKVFLSAINRLIKEKYFSKNDKKTNKNKSRD